MKSKTNTIKPTSHNSCIKRFIKNEQTINDSQQTIIAESSSTTNNDSSVAGTGRITRARTRAAAAAALAAITASASKKSARHPTKQQQLEKPLQEVLKKSSHTKNVIKTAASIQSNSLLQQQLNTTPSSNRLNLIKISDIDSGK